jgi:MOSC domain-containing protein
MARFRPNIVISRWDEPHLEDRVRWLTIGNAKLAYAKLAIRCAVPLVDQQTGAKAGREPLRTLAAYRRASPGGIAFGVKLSVVSPGKLAMGDNVCVSSWDDSEF